MLSLKCERLERVRFILKCLPIKGISICFGPIGRKLHVKIASDGSIKSAVWAAISNAEYRRLEIKRVKLC